MTRSPLLYVFVAHLCCAACSESQSLDAGAPVTLVRERLIASDTAYLLTRPAGMAVDDEGRLWVVEPTERMIFVFDSTGSLLRRLGREGRGPGEFEEPSGIGIRGDAVWVADARLRRIVWFNLEGQHLHTRSWATPPLPPGLTPAEVSSVAPDGSAIARPGVPAALLASGAVSHLPILKLGPAGEVMDTLHMLDMRNTVLQIEFGTMRSYTSQPFGAPDLWAPLPDGSGIVVADRTVAEEQSAVVRVIRRSYGGETVWSRDLTFDPDPITEPDVDSVVSEIVERRRGRIPDLTSVEAQARAKLHVADHYPPIDRIVAAADGSVLLRRRPASDDEERDVWVQLDPRGNPAGLLAIDGGASIRWADREHIWAVLRDSLGVPTVARYRLPRDHLGERPGS